MKNRTDFICYICFSIVIGVIIGYAWAWKALTNTYETWKCYDVVRQDPLASIRLCDEDTLRMGKNEIKYVGYQESLYRVKRIK